jgi:hypothetical protein
MNAVQQDDWEWAHDTHKTTRESNPEFQRLHVRMRVSHWGGHHEFSLLEYNYSALYLSHTSSFLGLISNSEDEGNMFLRNVGWLSTDYTAFHSSRHLGFVLLWEIQHSDRDLLYDLSLTTKACTWYWKLNGGAMVGEASIHECPCPCHVHRGGAQVNHMHHLRDWWRIITHAIGRSQVPTASRLGNTAKGISRLQSENYQSSQKLLNNSIRYRLYTYNIHKKLSLLVLTAHRKLSPNSPRINNCGTKGCNRMATTDDLNSERGSPAR